MSDKIKVSLDFQTGAILLKAMYYYVENMEDASNDIHEKMGKDSKVAQAIFCAMAANSLDKVRKQIRVKGDKLGWGKGKMSKEMEQEITANHFKAANDVCASILGDDDKINVRNN